MRHFHSYGPVDCEEHFCVQRRELIEQCSNYLVGTPGKQGHYFTLWAPRQAGKTWLMRQVKKEIEARYGEHFQVAMMSVQGVIMLDDQPVDDFLKYIPTLFREAFELKIDMPRNWDEFKMFFHKTDGLFEHPLILFIDEFDSLPADVIDQLVTLFRDMYLKKDAYLLHGLSLIGVRGVLGVGSKRGSPFNIQRSVQVPCFSKKEVFDLLSQYENETGQRIEQDVKEKLFLFTNGQPGLVCWFGELLTEKYNPGIEKRIDTRLWELICTKALHSEWNNTVLNLISKAKGEYSQHVIKLFTRSDIPFRLDAPWCSYLYMNGIIDNYDEVCRFASPFIQKRIYHALTHHLAGDDTPVLPLKILDELTDVFEAGCLNIPALLQRYRDYLVRLEAKGINPWKEQPRRVDTHIREASGHFHLYHWLMNAVGGICVITPEFPTGNGKVDLFLKCNNQAMLSEEKIHTGLNEGKNYTGLIEVKIYMDMQTLKASKRQAAEYAVQCGLDSVTIALFVPTDDDTVMKKLSVSERVNGTMVLIFPISWG